MNDTFVEKAKTWDSNPQIIALADLFAAELEKIVPDRQGLAILEFGCGTGLVGLRYAGQAATLHLVDTSPAMLAVLRSKQEARADQVHIHEGTLANLVGEAVAPHSLDWIISNMAVHHVEDISALIDDLRLLLKPGGRVTIGELITESGTFHAPEVVPHNGFDPHELARTFTSEGFTPNEPYTFVTMPKKDSDGVTRSYSAFILDAIRSSTK